MKKLLLLFLAASSVSANMSTWYNEDSYPRGLHDFIRGMHEIQGDYNYYKFESNLEKNQDVLDEFANNNRTGIISYLLFEDDKIVIDEVDMPPMIINGQLPSNSVGKSLVSYVAGHAICEGYISSVNEVMDWNLLDNTLYEGQTLLNILNMTAGDQNYIGEYSQPRVDNQWKASGENLNMTSLETIMNSNMQNTVKGSDVYNYSALTTHVLMNYVIYKAGDNWEKLLDKVFDNKNSVYFEKTRKGNGHSIRYSFYADRYDYLRIAKSIMDDWNSDGCVGDYLHTIYNKRIVKNDGWPEPHGVTNYTKSYGGQFYFDFVGLENREIIGLSGFAGQDIVIDTDNEKIIVVNSKYKNYDWEEIVYETIKE
jgi:CubicO group peptidase (beta-lactamase class C family)